MSPRASEHPPSYLRRLLPRAAIMAALALALPLIPSVAAAEQLLLDKRNVVAAPRAGRVLVLLALQEHRAKLRAMGEADLKAAFADTARHYLAEIFASDRYREGFTNADVVFAFVDNMDEYNRPNFGGMTRIGSASFQRDGDALKPLSVQVMPDALKQ